MMLNCYIMLYLPHTAAHFDTVIITVHSANRIPLATTHSWQDEHVAATPALRRPAGPGQTPWGLSGHRRCASGGWPLPCAPWCGWPSTWPRPWPRQLQSWRWCRCSKKPQLQALGSRCSQGGAATGVRHLRHIIYIMIIMASPWLGHVATCWDMASCLGRRKLHCWASELQLPRPRSMQHLYDGWIGLTSCWRLPLGRYAKIDQGSKSNWIEFRDSCSKGQNCGRAKW